VDRLRTQFVETKSPRARNWAATRAALKQQWRVLAGYPAVSVTVAPVETGLIHSKLLNPRSSAFEPPG
jgi:hypothetical protein